MEGRLSFGSAWYPSVHRILFSRMLIVILGRLKHTKPQFWLLFRMDVEHGLFHKGKNVQLGMSEDRILKRTCGPKRE
jgi:hypothetical protein